MPFNSDTKKKIAKEYLFLIVSIIGIPLLVFVASISYNFSLDIYSKIKHQNKLNALQEKCDSLNSYLKIFEAKKNNIKWLFNVYPEGYAQDASNENEYWDEISNIILIKGGIVNWNYNSYNKMFIYDGFISKTFTPESFLSFYERNTITGTDIANNTYYNQLKSKLDSLRNLDAVYLQKKKSFKEIISITKKALISVFLLIFLRYFYFSIIWSFKYIRKNNT
jgi:hypothetical protein